MDGLWLQLLPYQSNGRLNHYDCKNVEIYKCSSSSHLLCRLCLNVHCHVAVVKGWGSGSKLVRSVSMVCDWEIDGSSQLSSVYLENELGINEEWTFYCDTSLVINVCQSISQVYMYF